MEEPRLTARIEQRCEVKTAIELQLREVFSDTIDQEHPKAGIDLRYHTNEGDALSKGIPYTIAKESLIVRPAIEADGFALKKKIYEKNIPLESIVEFERFELANPERKTRSYRVA